MTETLRQRLGQNQLETGICEKVTEFLYRIGIHPDIKNPEFNYFYTAILAYMKYVPQHVMIEEIYQKVAQYHNTTEREVERVINFSLKKIWDTPAYTNWREEVVGKNPNKKMRNSQAIMFMARYLS